MERVCKDCGTVGEGKTVARGSFLMEVVLWLCFLVPGLIYSVWRLTSKRDVCTACGSENLVPLSSPLGQQVASATGHVPEPPRPPSAAAANAGRALGRLVGRMRK
jgi:hypothetical protein